MPGLLLAWPGGGSRSCAGLLRLPRLCRRSLLGACGEWWLCGRSLRGACGLRAHLCPRLRRRLPRWGVAVEPLQLGCAELRRSLRELLRRVSLLVRRHGVAGKLLRSEGLRSERLSGVGLRWVRLRGRLGLRHLLLRELLLRHLWVGRPRLRRWERGLLSGRRGGCVAPCVRVVRRWLSGVRH
ncbi:hypothetical protein GCM10020360_19200 [Nonlabens tegetincola]